MPDSNQGDMIVDIKELKEIMDDDMELIQECFTDFLSDCPQLLNEIQDAITKKDPDQINQNAHKLKGTLKYLAAESAANAAIAVESAGSDHDFQDLDKKFLALEDECRKLIDFIKSFTP
ncbi:MAG: Hpt domain-containing protein [Desulfobacteraceae bacterium]|nr:Hpt domain-containing protein [Desulfobacteraceae bacterium]